ncbi:potassium channel family protein [Sphingomonas sp. SM33]|uniref:Potassium channel family protein n=1 Tax=Sphingomonas telluris TaxID=2907998 RepID=A0ABS9VM22_9SPHN|nr:potassium channel family protein [Sphingomonas telluris]MCH8616021.1 potassium channel family protein [Sphingomonas telluris]
MAAEEDTSELLMLRRKPRVTGWFGLAWRIAAVVGLLGFLVVVHWLERDGLKDTHDGSVSFIDVLYFTMISATTTGYGDIVPVTPRTRLFDAFVVTPIRILFLLIFVGSAYLFVARRSWEKFLMRRIQRSLTDHIVVAGYGTKNRRAVDELIDLGANPEDIVVIDLDPERLERAKALGCTVLQGDAARDQTIRSVHVERAKLVIISAGRDDTSILICLTVRDFAPDVRISIAVNEEDNIAPARRAGANVVVNPLDFAGLLLATTHAGQHIADYLADLASMKGKVRLIERDVLPEEIGRSLKDVSDMGVRIIRGGTAYGFWRPQVQKLEAGDVIMEIAPTAAGQEPSPA